MNLLSMFRRTSAASSPATIMAAGTTEMTIASTPDQVEQFIRRGGDTASGVAVTQQTAMMVAAVFRCVTLISGAVATMPLHLKKRDGRKRLDASDHPLWTVLRRRPNQWQTPSQFKRQMQAHVLLRGRGRAMKVRGAGKRVIGLIPLNPDRVRTEQRDDLRLQHHYTRRNGSQIIIQQEDMFDLVGMSLDGWSGLSVLSCARETIGAAIAMRAHGANLFRNGTNAGGYIKHKGKLGPDGQALLKESLEAYRGPSNSGKTMILEEDMEFHPLGLSLADAEFIQTRGLEARDIFMFFGVPPYMGGDTEKSNALGTGLAQQTLGFQAWTMEDHLTTWEETILRDLLADDDPEIFPWFNRAAAVKNDIKERNASYTAGRNGGWLSKNDIRESENRDPIETPDGDDYSAPLNSNAKPGGDVDGQGAPRKGEE